jgi:hypothetical protein
MGATDEHGGGLSVYNVDTAKTKATAAAADYEASAPAVTPAANVADAKSNDDGIVSTSIYTKDGIVYEVAIKEVIETVTLDSMRRRHAHHHARNFVHGRA